MVNTGFTLCKESHKAKENLSIMFMHYVSHGVNMIQGRKGERPDLRD